MVSLFEDAASFLFFPYSKLEYGVRAFIYANICINALTRYSLFLYLPTEKIC